MSKKFHVGDILSITTGHLVSPKGMIGVHTFLNYLTGDTLWTHQLPRACDECAPYLYEQLPELAGIVCPDVVRGEDAVNEWLAGIVKQYGEMFDVSPIPNESHKRVHPLQDLADKLGGVRE